MMGPITFSCRAAASRTPSMAAATALGPRGFVRARRSSCRSHLAVARNIFQVPDVLIDELVDAND
jgi:hypothetical protein